MKTFLKILITALISLLVIGCKDDPAPLPCEIGEEHFNNAGSSLAELSGENFQGESVFTLDDEERMDFFISRFSLDQCYTSDLISIPNIGLKVLDTMYLEGNEEISYIIKSSQTELVSEKKINSNESSWILIESVNMDSTELIGEFHLEMVDEISSGSGILGAVTFDKGQFFSVKRGL